MRKEVLVQAHVPIEVAPAESEKTRGKTRRQPVRCEYELLLTAALRNPALAQYLRVEGLARPGSLPQALVA